MGDRARERNRERERESRRTFSSSHRSIPATRVHADRSESDEVVLPDSLLAVEGFGGVVELRVDEVAVVKDLKEWGRVDLESVR